MNLTFTTLNSYGRAGNQIFEVAALLGMAKKYGFEPAIPTNWGLRDYFNIPNEYYKDVDGVVKEEGVFHYQPNFLEGINHSVDLRGTYQSLKYFENIEDDIREWLTPKGVEYFGDGSVAIHIRRGDYVGNTNYINYTPEYYLSAIDKYFRGYYKYYICTDDVEYARTHFKGKNFIIEERTPIEDLKVLIGCQHRIICNSSFSWWGAFLANRGTTIRPSKIFDGRLAQTHSEKDFWVEHWIEHDGKIDAKDVTFIIPVKYDHRDRKENLDITISSLQKTLNTNIIVGEQGSNRFRSDKYRYVNFNWLDVFHRTKMLNRMTELANTPYVVNWDADIMLPPHQLMKMINLLRSGEDFVYPYSGAFLRVGDGTYGRRQEYIDLARKYLDVGVFKGDFVGADDKSVGGVIGYNKEKFLSVGGENEAFIAYAPEDVERHYRFSKLGKVNRVDGALYHLNHYCGDDSSTRNKYYQAGVDELNRVKSLSFQELCSEFTKRKQPKLNILLYADKNYEERRDVLHKHLYETGMFDDIIVYNRGHLEYRNFYTENQKILDQERGGGYWLWKPYYIHQTLCFMDEGDILVYLDSGDWLDGNVRDFLLNKEFDFILTDGAYRNEEWTKRRCFEKMGCDSGEHHNVTQLEAGVVVVRNNARTRDIVSEWTEWCRDEEVLCDDLSGREKRVFKEHRHDQSILTNLKVKYNLYSSSEMRQFVTCNVEHKQNISSDVTFVVPLFYDGPDRMKNIETVLRYYNFKFIVAEQLSSGFGGLNVDKYIYLEDKKFHRTKMINMMVEQADTDIVAVCDADVLVPQEQYEEAIRLISSGEADIVYPYVHFVKLDKISSSDLAQSFNFSKYKDVPGKRSVGGIFFVNKKKYREAGGENENFMVWGHEDVERYFRFQKLGLNVVRLDGNLYHLHHHIGANSSPINSYAKSNKQELEKVKSMDKDQLVDYIKTWRK